MVLLLKSHHSKMFEVANLKEYDNQIDTIKKQIASMQFKAEKNITEYKKNLEKDMEKSAVSLCAIILSKLNYALA